MLQEGERETEILLGNKQLLAIFFVGAALLGAAFTGGYMLGRRSSPVKTTVAATTPEQSAAPQIQPPSGQNGETHSVSPADDQADNNNAREAASGDQPLGSRKKTNPRQEQTVHMTEAAASAKSDSFSPQNGQEFLQVAAVPRDHAVAVAAVLRRKGFRAHAVPKRGEGGLYRVLVGPIRDAGELSSTRDSLRRTGFSQVLVQHYQ